MELQGTYTKQIEQFCEHFASFIIGDPPPDWPIPFIENCWYFHEAFIEDLYLTIEKAKKVLPDEQISRMFKNPSRILLYLLKFGYAFSSLSVSEKTQLATNLLKFASYYRTGDLYCGNGRNIIWDNSHMRDVLHSSIWFELERRDFELLRRDINRIKATLFLYCETVYPLCHPACHEIHGYYELAEDVIILVREYYDLRPEIWDFSSDLRIESIRIVEKYRKINMTIDMINAHGAVSLDSLSDNLLGFSIQINREDLSSTTEISDTLSIITEAAEKSRMATLHFSREDWIRKSIEIHFWQLRPLKEKLMENWRPSVRILDLSSKPVPDDFLSCYGQLGNIAKMPQDKASTELVSFLMKEWGG
jgi:hypothetical protein